MSDAQSNFLDAASDVSKYIAKAKAAKTPAEEFIALDLLRDAAFELQQTITPYQRVVRRKEEE